MVDAVEELGAPTLTARVVGAYDAPAMWTRSDDPQAAGRIAAAGRTLAALPTGPAHDADGCRPPSPWSRAAPGHPAASGPRAAAEAEAIARRLDDPALLALALNGRFTQSCARAGLAARRDAIGEELVALSARHGLTSHEVLGHLVRMQARAALGDRVGVRAHALAADRLAERHERPLVAVSTGWYRAMETGDERAVRSAATLLDGAGMPGLAAGLLPLTLLCLSLAGRPRAAREAAGSVDTGADQGPYRPWIHPFVLLGEGRRGEARTALESLPEPPAGLLYGALCCLEAAVALELCNRPSLERSLARLRPAAGQQAGAGSGLVVLGPVDRWLT